MKPPRSRFRTYLALARVSNLPTVWTNVLAGMALAHVNASTHARPEGRAYTSVAIAISLLYCGGMALNDVFDAEHDARARSDRPIPRGDISRPAAARFGGALMLGGVLLIALASRNVRADGWALALVAAILYYNWRHKRDPLGPVVMGMCRGLVYCCAAAVVADVNRAVIAGAAVVTAYVIALTLVAKYRGATYGWSIKWLIAGICVVDALVIAWSGAPQLALIALLGVPATIAGQRYVSGT